MFNFDYHNPNDFWIHKYEKHEEDYDEDDDYEGALKSGCFVSVFYLIGLAVLAVACLLFSGCTTTKYVPITEQHTEHHWHTDSVKERDSVHTENTTIIREVDSAAMAKYGIQMQNNQRAWLVLQREMENRLRELEHMTATRDTIHDSIPVPVPVDVVKEVPAKLTWWQQMRIHIGGVVFWLLVFAVAWYIGGLLRKAKTKFMP